MACLVQNNSSTTTAHLPVHETLSKKRKLASPNHFKNKRVQRIHDTTTSPPWTPLYPASRLEQEAIQYIHKFYCKDCQMDQEAAERAKAAASAGDDSAITFGSDGTSAMSTDVKQEPSSPMSPQQMTDEASLMVTLDKNKESLKRKLMMRRSLNELVDQGIYPSPKTPLAFMEQKKSLERAKIGDSLRFKISHRPDRQQLVQQHILEDTTIDPSLHERQRKLKKARLADSLNDKLSHRPGVLELIQDNILETNGTLHQLIKEGSLSFDKATEGEAYSNDGSYSCMCEDSKSSDEAFSPDLTDDSNLSDISSPPIIPAALELPTSFTKSLPFSAQIQFNQDSKVTLPLTSPPFSIPQHTANSSSITFTAGSFAPGTFVTPRSNVTVSTINNKSRPKKTKPKPQPKAKVIKFHEYKGPPNIVKSTQPVSSTAAIAAIGLGNSSSIISSSSTQPSPQPQPQQPATAAKLQQQQNSDTPYHILLQQQQLFLQWQLEFNQKNLNATVIVPAQKEGQPGVPTFTSLVSSAGSSGSAFTSTVESTPVSVMTQAPPKTVFTVTPTNQHAQPQAHMQHIRISSPVMTQIKQEPPVGQPQPQMNPNVTPIITTNKPVKKPTVGIAPGGPPKQYSSLEEMKVAELKAELKKRNLTVSGPKPQLIERLKPYADAIIKAPKDRSPGGSVTSLGSSVLSPTGSVISSRTGASPQPFSVMSPPNSVTSPQSVLMSSKTVVITPPGSVLGANSTGSSMTLPVVLSSGTGHFSQPGSVQSNFSSLKSPGSVNSTTAPDTSPSVSNSVLSRPGSVMSPVGSVIDEILCANAESPLPSIQSMQSAVSVTNMTMIPDDLSNPFSPPDSPLVIENIMTPLSPDDMDIPSPSPAGDMRQQLNTQQHNQLHNIPSNMEQSRPPSVLSVVPSEVDKIDMAMDIDLDLNQSLSASLAPALNSVSLGNQMSQSQPTVQVVSSGNQASLPSQASLQADMFKSQQDQQQMLNHIQTQLRILQEKQQQKQQQSTTSPYQMSQEELLWQQQEKIEKLQVQLQESQLQLQLQQLQHQQLQQQQNKLQFLQQQQIQQSAQPQAVPQQVSPAAPTIQVAVSQAAQSQAVPQVVQQQVSPAAPSIQVAVSQAAQSIQQQVQEQSASHGQPPVQMPSQQVQVTVQQPQVHINSQTARQITVQVPRSSAPAQIPNSSAAQFLGVQNTLTTQKPATAQQTSKPNQAPTPQVIFSVPNGNKAPTLGNLPPNMKQIQIPASWLTNIQSTPQGMSAVIVPQVKKTKHPNLEFIKNQAINQTLNLVGGKSLIAVSNSSGGPPQFIIAAAPPSKTSTAVPSSAPVPTQNGLTKPAQQKMTVSLPTSPVDGGNQHSSVTRTASNPFFIPMKEPPKYDEAIRSKQSMTPEANGNGDSPEKSQTMDDVLEILIRTGELPASAAQEPPPTPKTTSQSPTAPTVSVSHSNMMSVPSMVMHNQHNQSVMSVPSVSMSMPSVSMSVPGVSSTTVSYSGQDCDIKGNIDSVFMPYEDMVTASSLASVVKTEIKTEPCDAQNTVTVFPPVDNTDMNDFFDLNDVMNGDLNSMDWTPDPAFGDLDLTDTAGMSAGMDLVPNDQSMLMIPPVHSPQRSNRGSEPDLTSLGLADMDTNCNMQIDVPDWLDVIMPSTGFTPVSANAPVSFPADPILTPQTQKEVLDLFNFDDSDLNTPDLSYGSAWEKLTEPTSS